MGITRNGNNSNQSQELNLRLMVLIVATTAAGVAISTVAALEWGNENLLLLAVLAGFAAFSVRFDVSLFFESRVSVAVVPILVAGTIAGLPGVVVVALAAELAAYLGRGKPYYKSVFNAGALLVSGAAYVWVLQSLPVGNDSGGWPGIVYPTVAGTLVNFLVNSALVGLAIALASERSIVTVWKENYGWLPPHYMVLGVLAAGMASAYRVEGIAAMALVFVPVVIIRFAISLQQAHKELRGAHQQVKMAMRNLRRAYDGTLRSLLAALDNRDNRTGGHSERVAKLTLAIADELGIEKGTPDWDKIRCGALLHDVGKIAVPDAVLHKANELSNEEWDVMRRHPQVGCEIVNQVELLEPAGDIILAHHEHFDGSGYPRSLAGEEIPLGARIFAVADAYDAMTSDRPYRKAMPATAALGEIRRCSGTQFDPQVVDAFLQVISKTDRSERRPEQTAVDHSPLPAPAE